MVVIDRNDDDFEASSRKVGKKGYSYNQGYRSQEGQQARSGVSVLLKDHHFKPEKR